MPGSLLRCLSVELEDQLAAPSRSGWLPRAHVMARTALEAQPSCPLRLCFYRTLPQGLLSVPGWGGVQLWVIGPSCVSVSKHA